MARFPQELTVQSPPIARRSRSGGKALLLIPSGRCGFPHLPGGAAKAAREDETPSTSLPIVTPSWGSPAAAGRDTRKVVPAPARLELDPPAVFGDQLARHEQAQAGAVLLRREIGLEQPGRVLRGDAGAVVAHRDRRRRRRRTRARSSMWPPRRVASMALRTRLRNTCTSWSRTPNSGGRSAGSAGVAMRPLGALVILGDVQRLVEDVGQGEARALAAGRPAEIRPARAASCWMRCSWPLTRASLSAV